MVDILYWVGYLKKNRITTKWNSYIFNQWIAAELFPTPIRSKAISFGMAICTVGGFISPLVIEGIGFLTSRETLELGFSVRYHHFVNHEKLNKPYHSRKNGCLHAVFIIFSNIIYGCSWNHFPTRNVSSRYSNSSCFIVHASRSHASYDMAHTIWLLPWENFWDTNKETSKLTVLDTMEDGRKFHYHQFQKLKKFITCRKNSF